MTTMLDKSGIYEITNTKDGKFYVGSAVNLRKRFNEHRCGIRSNKRLQAAINKHGLINFSFQVLEACEKEKLLEREQFWIDKKQPNYNFSPTAGSSLGIKRSKAFKKKISDSQKGKVLSEKTKEKIRESCLLSKKSTRFFRKQEVDEILLSIKNGDSQRSLARRFSVSLATIQKILNGKTYRDFVGENK